MVMSGRSVNLITLFLDRRGGGSGGAIVLGKLPVPGRPTIWITVGQGPTALAVGAGGGCLDIFILIYPFSPLSPSLWETARYRLKYCLKGPLNPKQPINQPWQAKKPVLRAHTFASNLKVNVSFQQHIGCRFQMFQFSPPVNINGHVGTVS